MWLQEWRPLERCVWGWGGVIVEATGEECVCVCVGGDSRGHRRGVCGGWGE